MVVQEGYSIFDENVCTSEHREWNLISEANAIVYSNKKHSQISSMKMQDKLKRSVVAI